MRPAVLEPVELAGAAGIIVIGLLGLALRGSMFANFLTLAQPETIRAGGTNQLYSGSELVEVATGLVIAVFTGKWYMKQIYDNAYFPFYGFILLLGASGVLPRVRASTQGEGIERRYFYGSVWAVTIAQTGVMILWKTLPRNHTSDVIELVFYVAALVGLGICAAMGLLPRTRPILPGELIVAD